MRWYELVLAYIMLYISVMVFHDGRYGEYSNGVMLLSAVSIIMLAQLIWVDLWIDIRGKVDE